MILRALALMALLSSPAQAQTFSSTTETPVDAGLQFKGLVTLEVAGKPLTKRFVIRVPNDVKRWTGSLVIGAHGGGGGDDYDRTGRVIGTDETALDDVVGRYSLGRAFAYASVDRDGTGGRDGLALTYAFTAIAKAEVEKRMRRAPSHTYIVGLSAGGGITRMAIEDDRRMFDGAVIIAGAGGDVPTRLDKAAKMAALWPLIDPRVHPGLPATDPNVRAYAEAIGTPVEARRLWPYSGSGAAAAAARQQAPGDNSSGIVKVPTIEVVGTWDDLMIRELRAYAKRVQPQAMHRLYQVEGVWHMSGDDDGVASFEYIAESRMKLPKDVADAMADGPSYLPTVREAFDLLVRWVEKGTVPPSSQTVRPGPKLR
ncbi:MAG: alpha/beta hydrolase domain-containing protein [Vicinamibacterales bacterium]